MKNLIVTLLLAVSIQSYGQFNKGDMAVGGTMSFTSESAIDNQIDVLYFELTPSFEYLLSKNVGVGALVGFASYRRDSEPSITNPSLRSYKYNNYTTGLFVQRYFTINDKFLFTLLGSLSYESDVKNSSDNRIKAMIKPNFIFFPSENWGILASIGNVSYTSVSDGFTKTFGVNFGTINFGVAYYFRKKTD